MRRVNRKAIEKVKRGGYIFSGLVKKRSYVLYSATIILDLYKNIHIMYIDLWCVFRYSSALIFNDLRKNSQKKTYIRIYNNNIYQCAYICHILDAVSKLVILRY